MLGGSVRSKIVLLPIYKALFGLRLITVLPTIVAGPPTKTIVPLIGKAEGLGVNI